MDIPGIKPTHGAKRLRHVWTYSDAQGGAPLGFVARYDGPDGDKACLPYFRKNGAGWLPGGPPEPRPLFGLEWLTATPDRAVIVTEGEKCAAALHSLGLVAVTSQGGSKVADKADWTPLSGRQKVVILPDHDESGLTYAHAVCRALSALPEPPRVVTAPLPGLPDKGDVVDWLQARLPDWDGFQPIPAGDRGRLRQELEAALREVATPPPPAWQAPAEGWPDPAPLPNLRPPVPPFEPDLLPDALRPWLMDIAERMQCPPEFPAVAALVCLSSLIGRQLGIRPKRQDDWLVVPNLWGCCIGHPGVMKTPAVEEPMKPMNRLRRAALEAHEAALSEHEAAVSAHESLIQAAKKAMTKEAAKKVASLSHWREARESLAGEADRLKEIEANAPQLPILRRYLTSDPTAEKLGELLKENTIGILLYRDELSSWLKGLDRDGREESRGFYLQGWNGTGSYTFDRIGRGTVHVEAVCISILGSIQPGPLSVYVWQATHHGVGNDGLLQRFQLLVWPDDAKTWRNVDRWPDKEARQTATAVFERLNSLDTSALGAETDEEDGIPFLRFSPKAQDLFNEWRTELETKKLRSGEPEALEAHLAKYRSLAPSLALLFHLVDNGTGPVTVKAAARAFDWCEFLEPHARRVYGAATIKGLDSAHALAAKIQEGRLPAEFTPREVYLKGWARLDKEGLGLALEVLEDCGWLQIKTVPTGGRPTKRVTLNPKLVVNHG